MQSQHLPKKPIWTRPTFTVFELKEAQGAKAGPLCDKHGSLSQGKGC